MESGMIVFPSWPGTMLSLLPAIALPFALALLAWTLRAVTAAAALTGGFLALVLYLAAGPTALLPVLAVFVLTYFSTRIGHRKKTRLGTAEPRQGRGPAQILANVSVSAICATPLIFVDHPRYILLAGLSAALAEAAGDTVSSELGQALGGTPRLITTLRRVPTGSDGAITLPGTVFAFLAAAFICLACQSAGLLLPDTYWTVLMAAFLGTLLDSLLGATLERPGRLGNNSVNFASSAFSAALAIVVLFLQA
jgi:uncharacterized protein (TIGR00297 family)